MQVTIQSNIAEWTKFFQKFAAEHPKIPGSALGSDVNLNFELVNTAVALDKTGNAFPYFRAVDIGRKAVTAGQGSKLSKGGHVLAFAGRGGGIIFRRSVAATFPGKNIIIKALAKVNATYQNQFESAFAAWAQTANEDVILSKKLQSLSVGSTKTLVAANPADVGVPYDNTVLQLINKSKIQFNPNKLIAAFGPLPVGAQIDDIKRLIKIPNWYAISAIAMQGVGDQIETSFKPVTPSRKEEGKYKLAYVGTGRNLTLLDPSTGGGLRNGYKLIYSSSLGALI